MVGVDSAAEFVLTTEAVVEERGCLDLMKSGRAYRYNISSTERNSRVIWMAPVPCTLTFFSTCLAPGGGGGCGTIGFATGFYNRLDLDLGVGCVNWKWMDCVKVPPSPKWWVVRVWSGRA